jgi:hypothetical protein
MRKPTHMVWRKKAGFSRTSSKRSYSTSFAWRMKTSKKGRMMWSLQGDKNTDYFHVVANKKRSKCNIFTLSTPNGRLTDKKVSLAHVNDYYG